MCLREEKCIVHIVVTINVNYLKPLCVMLRSLLDAHPDKKIVVHVIHTELRDVHYEIMKNVLADERLCFQDIRVDDDFLPDLPVTFHFSKEMYYRIFSAKLLDESIERALYLDPDMIVLSPLDELYEMDMGQNFFAAARSINRVSDRLFAKRLKMPKGTHYFNSGVLLMNLSALRQQQSEDEVFAYIQKNRGNLILPDQDILNALYYNKTVLLDPYKYNFDVRYYDVLHRASGGRISLENMPETTCIVHYCGKEKPWNEDYRGECGVFYRLKQQELFRNSMISEQELENKLWDKE